MTNVERLDTKELEGDFLIRTIESYSQDASGVQLRLGAVSYQPLGSVAGIITSEPPNKQGLESLLPNAPSINSDDDAPDPTVRASASLYIRAYSPNTIRITMVPDHLKTNDHDGIEFGILIDRLPQLVPVTLVETGTHLDISTTQLTLRLTKEPFSFELLDLSGNVVTMGGGNRRQVAGFPFEPTIGFSDNASTFSLEIQPSEYIVGLGEQFTPFIHNGASFELIANDGLGVGTGLVYKPAPIFHSSRGYSAFVHGPGPMKVDVGNPYPSVLKVANEEARLDLFLIAGVDLPSRLSLYTELTGRMRVPPRWAFGLWMSRCRYPNRASLEEAAHGMRDHQIPCDVLHIDPDWLVLDRLNCDFIWSQEKYPDPKEMMATLLEEGFHISLWELPYLDEASPITAEAKENGYLVRDSSGAPAKVDRTFSRDGRPRRLLDFSNPAARQWWKEKNKELLALGVSVLKCDFGEGLPNSALMSDGRTGRNWRNLYPFWYSRTVSEAIDEERDSNPLVWSRSGWASSQRYPAQWGGDPEASFAGLANSLRGGLSWALSAPGMWSHDVGGFYGMGPSKELYIRWAQVGSLSPLTRFHGLTPREPWHFGEEACDIVRRFVNLRYQLIPNLISAAFEGEKFGWPMLRPLIFADETNLDLYRVEHEFLIGSNLLVVAVLSNDAPTATVEVVLPSGHWSDFWSGESHLGPKKFEMEVPLDKIPIFVRSGAAIAFGPLGQHTGEIPSDTWEIEIWESPQCESTIYQEGHEFRYRYIPSNPELGTAPKLICDEPMPRTTQAHLHKTDGTVVHLEIQLIHQH
ncbi:glycoside hydrolase family 31 protein [Acidithrix ferrooxidans]|uniref:Alpha-xylosidase n=2 Tax=root TaxID=1 RepID=A0A0D8HIE2_9ACTN|nr:TIM-barrel domain-containing protein [Acidithrix ferrooxidans]KJF16826.1 alpha-xylosidase [Acidithrix ferrooxidans]